MRGNPEDPLSRGHICPKGVALADVYTDPDRLRRPCAGVGDTWVELGWDEAFDLVADRLAAVHRGARPPTRSASTSATPTRTASAR